MDQNSVFQQPGQNKLELEGDLRILNKQKNDILKDIERLQKSKADQYNQYTHEIEPLKVQKDQLIEQIAILNRKLSESRENSVKESKAASDFANGIVKKAENEAKALTDEAKNKMDIALLKERDTIADAKLLEDHKQSIAGLDRLLEIRGRELDTKEADIKKQNNELVEKLAETTLSMSVTTNKLKELEDKITSKTAENTILDKQIGNKTEKIKVMDEDIKRRTFDVESREKIVSAKEYHQAQKDIELTNKEKWLEDREKTLGRAYDEIIAKGGKVDE